MFLIFLAALHMMINFLVKHCFVLEGYNLAFKQLKSILPLVWKSLNSIYIKCLCLDPIQHTTRYYSVKSRHFVVLPNNLVI